MTDLEALEKILHLPPASIVKHGLQLLEDHPMLKDADQFRDTLLQAAFDTDLPRRYQLLENVCKAFGICLSVPSASPL